MSNSVFTAKGVLITQLKKAGMKGDPSPKLVEFDELLPELTDEELGQLHWRLMRLIRDMAGHA